MSIGWRQFDTWTWNFRQGGWGYTPDGGLTWTFPGVLEPSVFRSDPVLNSDETGKFFYLSLLETFCDNIWRSTNGGQSWLELQPDGNAGGGDRNGSPSIRPMEWATVSNTRRGARQPLALAACSAALLTGESHGKPRSICLTLPGGEHWMLLLTATFSLGAEMVETGSGASARPMHRIRV
jgi:hypothetical protein